ncbi:unnamed protein product [Brassica rapa subsp. narinosa]
MAVDAAYLMQFVDETSFYNRIVLSHLLPSNLWDPLPHFLQTWLRNYLAGTLLYFISGFLWCFYIYYLKLNVYLPRDAIPTRKAMLLQISVAMKAMPWYTLLPTVSEHMIESGWTKCYSRIGEVSWFLYFLSIAVYLVLVEFGIYWMHRELHDIKPLYKYLHATHHIYNKQNTLSPFAEDEQSQAVTNRGPEVSGTADNWVSPSDIPLIEPYSKEHKMREAQLGAHTVRSHGMTLARTHMHDWIILVLLVVLECILLIIHPFYRFVSKDMMTDLSFPLKSNTVPIWSVPVYAMLLPLVIFIAIYFRRRDVYDLHHAVLGLLYSVLVTAVLTDSIKNAVGRPRPDFFWRCFPDGKAFYDSLGDVICHGDKSVIREGHKSFPSGHTSWSFAGLGFLSLYLSGKIQAFDGKGHVAKLCIVILPLLVAALVGISRVDDYWHHWQDVFAGGLLGLVVSTFCYLQFFPPPYHTEAWGPYAYFQVLEAARAQAQAAENGVAQGGNGEEEDGGFMGLHLVDNPSMRREDEDVEAGRVPRG